MKLCDKNANENANVKVSIPSNTNVIERKTVSLNNSSNSNIIKSLQNKSSENFQDSVSANFEIRSITDLNSTLASDFDLDDLVSVPDRKSIISRNPSNDVTPPNYILNANASKLSGTANTRQMQQQRQQPQCQQHDLHLEDKTPILDTCEKVLIELQSIAKQMACLPTISKNLQKLLDLQKIKPKDLQRSQTFF